MDGASPSSDVSVCRGGLPIRPRPFLTLMNVASLSQPAGHSEFPVASYANESQWLSFARRGDIVSFNHIIRAYQDMAYRIAHYVLDDSDSAINATQNAFVRAQKDLQRCPRDKFRLWFLQILLQECKNGERAAWSKTPGHSAHTAPVQIGLATIPFDDRIVCVLSDMIGLKDEDISTVTRTSCATLREQRSRARRQLRDVIQML